MEYRSRWDRLGIALSLICLAHCLLLPVALVALPLFAVQWLQEGTVHVLMALMLAPVAALALVPGLKLHRSWGVAGAMAAGLGLISTAAFAGEGTVAHEWTIALTVAGGALLVAAHFVNLRLCRSCPACASHHDSR
ncbi:MAG: MerC domain-containing protein [Betaproteobacteria bacterium]|nr:MerC domain-containing protein [Betaproteobacteria bacterium]